MSDFYKIFNDLSQQFAHNTDWITVEDWLYPDDNDEESQSNYIKFWSLPMCSQNLGIQDQQLQILRELSNCIRSLRNIDGEQQNGYAIGEDNWAKIEDISPKEYLTYIYALTSLAILPPQTVEAAPELLNENNNLQLALNAVSTYFLTLTIPGAKSFGVFNEGVIEHCLKVFKLLEQNVSSGVRANNIWILFLTICDDLKLLFRYVHFRDHKNPRNNIMRCLMEILYMNFRLGFKNSCK